MHRVTGLSNFVYAFLLRLYPSEFRRRWAEEMTETFALQVDDAWREGGFPGVMRIWCWGLAELFQIAFPLQLARPAVVVPVISIAANTAILWSLFWALHNSRALTALGRSLWQTFGG